MAFNTTLKHFTSSQELASIWATGENYLLNQLVLENDVIYRCAIAHTSGATFATDLGAGKWVAVSAAGASGSKNYIENGDFEDNNTTGWSLFNTTINSTTKIPTGSIVAGAAGFNALSVSGSSPLAGSYSLSVSTAAGVTITTTGYGFISDAFTIDREDQAKVMGFSFYYEAVSGTMNFSGTSSNTFAVYIRDVSGGAWIQPAGVYNLVQSSGSGICSGTFQTTATGTQYQVAVLMINTVSAAVSMRFDDFQLGPQKVLAGAAISDWVSYTPVFTGMGSGSYTSATGRYRRVGDSYEVQIEAIKDATSGTGAANIACSVPFTIDTSKFDTSSTGSSVCGTFLQSQTAYSGVVLVESINTVSFYTGTASGSFKGSMWLSNSQIGAFFTLPAAGLSSNTVLSQDTDTRVVAASAYGSPAIASAGNPIIFATSSIDTHASYSVSTGRYTVPVSGKYRLSYVHNSTNTYLVTPYINAVNTGIVMGSVISGAGSGSIILDLQAGQIVDHRPSGSTGAFSGSGGNFSIERLSGPATIAASESVVLRAYASGGQTLTTSTSTIQYNNKTFDSHSAFNTSTYTFTAPISGTYLVSAKYYMSNSTPCYIGINGLNYSYSLDGDANGRTYQITDFIQLLAGQTVTIGGQAITGSGTLGVGAGSREHTLNIVRVGN